MRVCDAVAVVDSWVEKLEGDGKKKKESRVGLYSQFASDSSAGALHGDKDRVGIVSENRFEWVGTWQGRTQ